MPFDPLKPLHVTVELDSPHYVVFNMWYKKPQDDTWTSFAGGKDDEPSKRSSHGYELPELPKDTDLHYFFHFAGHRRTAYSAMITILQGAVAVAKPTVLKGLTDDRGLAMEKKEMRLS